MPQPKRANADDYFAQLPAVARPHLEALRKLALGSSKRIEEALHWNSPAYLVDGVRVFVLQSFKAHGALRFPTHQFAAHVAEVQAAGYEAGEGFIKLPYDKALPTALCKRLIQYRLDEFAATGSKWN